MKSMHMIGNAHIDPVWLWQWQEGFHEVHATFRSALDRMEENPEYVFTCACACYYRWIELSDPAMFEEIRKRVQEGRWVIVGGMWIQPDMNTPSGESLARQMLVSQRYFHEKFGVTALCGYNVDSFGHNANTPQFLKKAGMTGYVWMRPSAAENEKIPEGPFIWQAPDGSEVTAYRIHGEYTTGHSLEEKIQQLRTFSERLRKPVMCYYGIGNHGGGPTKENLKRIDAKMETDEDIAYSSPNAYFEQLRHEKLSLPVWQSELQHHASGCYSTHSRSKKLHRETENALLRMETFTVLAGALIGHVANKEWIDQAWRDLLFNEFHDIMGGCCIPEALTDAERLFAEAITIAQREENAAIQRVSWQIDTMKGLAEKPPLRDGDTKHWEAFGLATPIVVFNPHSFDAADIVRLRGAIPCLTDDSGNALPSQSARASRTNGKDDRFDTLFRPMVPAMGYKLFWARTTPKEEPETCLQADLVHMENQLIRAEFDECGQLTHLIDKRTGLDTLRGPMGLKLYDISHCDTWAHNVFRFDQECGVFAMSTPEMLENGPVRAMLRVKAIHERSVVEMRYILEAESPQLRMEIHMQLIERHKILKLCVPCHGRMDVAEIAYGAIERKATGNEEHCQRFVAMQAKAQGLALLNNGRYSYSAVPGEIRMTLANTSIMADHFGQQYRDAYCRYMDQGEQEIDLALIPFTGNWRDAELFERAALFNRPFIHLAETFHAGPLPAEYSAIRIEGEGVQMGAIKRSEDNSGYVVRMAETRGRKCDIQIELHLNGRAVCASFSPFEIKTLYLPDNPSSPAREMLLTELEN